MDIKIFKYSIHNSCYFYWNIATGLFYLSLFLSCFLIKKNINSLICYYSLIGLFWCIIFFLIEYFIYKDFKSAGVCAGLILIEEIFQIASIYYSDKKDYLEEDKKMNNLIIIDGFKYFVVLLISLIVTVLIFLFILLFLFLKSLCCCCFCCCYCCRNSEGGGDYYSFKEEYEMIVILVKK